MKWNFKEKMERKTFLTDVWLEEGEGKKIGGLGCYLPRPTKCFLSKMERKLSGRNLIDKWRKYQCASAHGLVQYPLPFFLVWSGLYVVSSPLPSSSFFFLPVWTIGRCLLLFFLFLFSFDFVGNFIQLLFFFFFFSFSLVLSFVSLDRKSVV